MMYRISSALIASAAVAALMLPASDALAQPGAAAGGRIAAAPSGRVASARAMVRPPGAPAFRHRRGIVGGYWPGGGYFYGGYPDGQAYPEVVEQAPRDVHYSYTYDVPWDWAHRYPPNVVPSDKPYISSCPVEHVRTSGRDGSEQTINVTRCY